MPLEPDAQAIADGLAVAMPQPLHTLGVAGARALIEMLAQNRPAPREHHEVIDRTIPGPAGEIPVRVYRPGPGTDLPVLIYLHGGGWTIGTLDGVDDLCRVLSAGAGCVVVSVDYRLAPEHPFPAAFDDTFAALEWVAAKAEEIGADGSRIAIGGDSAGANLAAAACVAARDRGGPAVVLQVLAYPATEYAVQRPSWVEHAHAPMLTADDVVWFWGQYLAAADRADPRATPANAGSLADLPPAFVATAEYDPIRDDGEEYARKLAAEGVPVQAIRYDGVFHGFFTLVGMTARTGEANAAAVAALTKAFAP